MWKNFLFSLIRTTIVPLIIDAMIKALTELSKKSDNEVDDALVKTLTDIQPALVDEIHKHI